MYLIQSLARPQQWVFVMVPICLGTFILQHLICYSKCRRADNRCLSTSNLYSCRFAQHAISQAASMGAYPPLLTHEESQKKHLVSNFWREIAPLPEFQTQIKYCIRCHSCSSSISKSAYLFLDLISPRLSNKVSLASCFVYQHEFDDWAFQVIRQCFAQKNQIFLRYMSHRSRVTSAGPLVLSSFTLMYVCINMFSELKVQSHIN